MLADAIMQHLLELTRATVPADVAPTAIVLEEHRNRRVAIENHGWIIFNEEKAILRCVDYDPSQRLMNIDLSDPNCFAKVEEWLRAKFLA
jgi:hypothetical protein